MNTLIMFRNAKLHTKFLLQLWKTPKLRRTFLSESYRCQEAWNNRFKSSLLHQINPVEFFVELDQNFQTHGRVSAVDIDIFANCIKDVSHLDELTDVLHKHRLTKDTTYTLDSTHHAVIRYFLEMGKTEILLNILNDRLNYGIFCDYFCYNLLMDHFIKKQDFASAAKTASYLMLQETFEHPISNALAIYSCHKYLENSGTWQEVDPASLRDEPKEEVKIRVRYLINPYFDDHFDLWKPSDLVGKTLFLIGQSMNNCIGRSCHLRGLLLYKKYTDAITLLNLWKQEKIDDVVYKDILPIIKKDIPELFSKEVDKEKKELLQLLSDLENADLRKKNFNEDIAALLRTSVEENSENDIKKQIKLYDEWEKKRIEILQSQLAEIHRQARLAKLDEIKKDLFKREQLLTFFENEEKIELQIEAKLKREKELYGEPQVSLKDQEENYIPPEIVKKRLSQ